MVQRVRYGATVVGIAADAIAQMAKPNVGQYWEAGDSYKVKNDDDKESEE
jgi:hypothetical protein